MYYFTIGPSDRSYCCCFLKQSQSGILGDSLVLCLFQTLRMACPTKWFLNSVFTLGLCTTNKCAIQISIHGPPNLITSYSLRSSNPSSKPKRKQQSIILSVVDPILFLSHPQQFILNSYSFSPCYMNLVLLLSHCLNGKLVINTSNIWNKNILSKKYILITDRYGLFKYIAYIT